MKLADCICQMYESMKKKFLVLTILMCTFTTTLLNGCGKKQNATPDNETQQDTETVTDQTVLEEQADSGEEGISYTWQDITVTLPQEWEDSYEIVEEDDGFSIYQKSSYDKNQGLGFLCGFTHIGEFRNGALGETLIAYADDGSCYYWIEPTDLAYDENDASSQKEYEEMAEMVPQIVATVKISGDGVHTNADEYVLPLSDKKPLTSEMLDNLNDNELMIARNEIYARHGRTFQNEYLQSYFNKCSWYQGTTMPEEFDESVFSAMEKDNLSMLEAKEEAYESEHPYPKKYEYGTVIEEDLNADGNVEQIFCSLMEQKDGSYVPIVTINGRAFDISKDCQLISPVTDCFYVTDITAADGELELAFLDYGPSCDPETYFFRFDGDMEFVGSVDGFPFKDQNDGINGFVNDGQVIGRIRTDLLETAYLNGFWLLNEETHVLEYQKQEEYDYISTTAHQLYEKLPVRVTMNENAPEVVMQKQAEVYFLKSDLKEWILVKGKDGTKGYMQVKNGKVVELGKSANNVFSDLNYFD